MPDSSPWFIIPRSVIASDPIPGKASPAERGDLAAQSFAADEIAKSEQRHSPAVNYTQGGGGRVGEYRYRRDWLVLALIGAAGLGMAALCRWSGGY